MLPEAPWTWRCVTLPHRWPPRLHHGSVHRGHCRGCQRWWQTAAPCRPGDNTTRYMVHRYGSASHIVAHEVYGRWGSLAQAFQTPAAPCPSRHHQGSHSLTIVRVSSLARQSAVRTLLSWSNVSAPLSTKKSTMCKCPAVAASIIAVQPYSGRLACECACACACAQTRRRSIPSCFGRPIR